MSKFIVNQIMPANDWYAIFEVSDESFEWIPLVCWAVGNETVHGDTESSSSIVFTGLVKGMIADENGKVLVASSQPGFVRYDMDMGYEEVDGSLLN